MSVCKVWQSELPRAKYAKTVKRTVDCRHGCTKKKCESMRFRDKRRGKKELYSTGLLLGDQFEDTKRKHLSTKKHMNKRTRYATGEGMG